MTLILFIVNHIAPKYMVIFKKKDKCRQPNEVEEIKGYLKLCSKVPLYLLDQCSEWECS